MRESLKLLHPFMPFITEEIWEKVGCGQTPLAVEQWPTVNKAMVDKKAAGQMGAVIELITGVRNLRAAWHVAQTAKTDCIIASNNADTLSAVKHAETFIKALARLENLTVAKQAKKPKDSATGIAGKITFHIPLSGIIDIAQEKKRIANEIKKHTAAKKNLSARLNNKQFLSKAPAHIVEQEQLRLQSIAHKIAELTQTLKELA